MGYLLRLHRLFGMLLAVFVLGGLLIPTVYAEPVRAGTSMAACPTPPNGFDILHASLDQIHYYGLPRPPEGNAQERAAWAKSFQNMHFSKRICGDGVVNTQSQPRPLQQLRQTSGPSPMTSVYYSTDWSGYFATNGAFTRVIADWIVPTRYSSPSPDTSLQWVGLGGVYTAAGSNLWQAGTETDNQQGYRMWYEAYPSPVVYAGPAISPGNEVYVNVDYGYTYAGKSYVYMYNYSNGQYYSAVKSFVPNTGTADWIVERAALASNHCNTYLTKTSQVSWSYAFAASTAAGGNTLHNIGYYGNVVEIMAEGSTTLEYTSVLGTDNYGGSTFYNTFAHNGTYCYK